ncbi:MAG: hypothetical protein ACI8YQ_004822 [Polaribacter sp.]|jgi:hypothetical protein
MRLYRSNTFMKNLTLLFLLTLSPLFLFAQEEKDHNLRYEDHVYVDNIRSVKFILNGNVESYPFIPLDIRSNRNFISTLVLSFDEIGEEVTDYVYTLVHCDSEWKPSNISEAVYMDGFNEDDVDNYDFSFNTTVNYTNYKITLPNSEVSWTKTGNYLLKVYDNTDDRFLIITRRFVVYDPKVSVQGRMQRTAMVSKSRTHQELDFTVNHEDLPLQNPQSDIKVVVLQNGRWDTAIKPIRAMFIKPNELIYDLQDKIVFPAGREFRQADLRTFNYNTNSIAEIRETRDRFDITLTKDISRSNLAYLFNYDLNGKYVIQSLDERDGDLRADYGYVLFILEESPPFSNHDVYLFGELTGWKTDERYKMVYNPLINAYVGQFFLKQGFYDYLYAVVDRDEPKVIDFDELEGSWHETENDYTVLVYYTPFGARYEQVIAVAQFNSIR